MTKNTLLFLCVLWLSCKGNPSILLSEPSIEETDSISVSIPVVTASLVVGANQMDAYLPLLRDKKVALVGNQTSVVFKSDSHKEYAHLVDTLLARKVVIEKVMAPEHGFRGTASAGEYVSDGKDKATGIPILSLYGKNKKPSAEHLKGIDIILFDIQDVGARFYTYISTLHHVMEAAAEQRISLIILDRPNPNGHYVDGPILQEKYQSFVGMHPVPVVHGMTIGEYAQMINNEGWLANAVQADLTVIPVKEYTHDTPYSLPIKPSPNLPNDTAVNLYPSLCFLEATPISEGRGTDMPFQVFGAPYFSYKFTYTPTPNPGAKHPKFSGKECHGKDLRQTERLDYINLEWLIESYVQSKEKSTFFTPFFIKLAGTPVLQQQIEQGLSADAIRDSWQKDITSFQRIRKKYLLYP